MTLPGWIAAIAGLVLLLRRDRKLAVFLLALVLVGSFGLIPILNFDIEREDVFVNRVFLMPAYLVLGLGLAVLFVKLIRSLPAERGRPAAATALLVLPLLAAGVRFSAHDRSNYYWAEDFARTLLEPLPRDTVLVPGGDTTTFPVIYLQRCLGKRRDVLILDRSGTIERELALELLPADQRDHFAEAPRKVLIEAVVRYGSRPVVCLTRLGLSAGSGYSFEPFGVGFLAVPGPLHGKRRDAWVARQHQFIENARLRNLEEPTVSDYTTDVISAEWWQVQAAQHLAEGHPPRALEAAARAAQHARGIKETLNNIGALLAEHDLCTEAGAYMRTALDLRADYLMARRNLLLTCRRAGNEGAALREAVRGLVHHPNDEQLFEEGVHAAMALGDGDALKHLCQVRIEACSTDSTPHRYLGVWALEHERSPVAAQAHFQRALGCDPDDAEAKEALARLDGALPRPERPEVAQEGRGLERLAALVNRPLPGMGFDAEGPGRLRAPGTSPEPIPGAQNLKTLLARLEREPWSQPEDLPAMPGPGPSGGVPPQRAP